MPNPAPRGTPTATPPAISAAAAGACMSGTAYSVPRPTRAPWRVLALVSVPGSIHYIVLPGLHRDQVLARPQVLAGAAAADDPAWWRLTEVT